MTPSDFDAPDAATRIDATRHFLDAPSRELVNAFCVRWSASATRGCRDTAWDPSTGEEARARAMGAYEELNVAFAAGMKALRVHPRGLELVLEGWDEGGERARVACLRGLPGTALLQVLERLAVADRSKAVRIARAVFAAVYERHAHYGPLSSFLAEHDAAAP